MITVVKIGGRILDDEAALRAFCRDFTRLGGQKLLVHGGNVLAGRLQEALGIPVRRVEGRRVTDEQTLQAVTMVYAGWYNKQLVVLLQAAGCNAIGLSGCDASCITSLRRPPVKLSDGSELDFGFVGDVKPSSIDMRLVLSFLQQGLVPVFSAINHDGRGQLLNTNADTVASAVAAALGARLIYCFEKPGVLADQSDDSSALAELDPPGFAALKASGAISEGMLPKLETAFASLAMGAAEVIVKDAASLLKGGGTKIRL